MRTTVTGIVVRNSNNNNNNNNNNYTTMKVSIIRMNSKLYNYTHINSRMLMFVVIIIMSLFYITSSTPVQNSISSIQDSNHDDDYKNNKMNENNYISSSSSSKPPCSTLTTCIDCSESSLLCHWCAFDQQCHEIGSIHGCLHGATCQNDNDHYDGKNHTQDDAICASHSNCQECKSSSSICHWCDFDQRCHAKGSIYGCAFGSSCTTPNSDSNHTHHSDKSQDNACKTHSTCTECTLSSSLCHWCAFDNQCHAIGSWYGCTAGTNCYSNDRCQRTQPEPIDYHYNGKNGYFPFVSEIGFIPLFIILSIMFLMFGCSTILYAGVSALKGAYDDLSTYYNTPMSYCDRDDLNTTNSNTNTSIRSRRRDDLQLVVDGTIIELDEESEEDLDAYHPLSDTKLDNQNNNNNINHKSSNTDEEESHSLLLPPSSSSIPKHHIISPHPHPSRLPPTRTSKHMDCCLNICKLWYGFTVICLCLFATFAIYYFPKIPQFNVCSDQFAWKSIIDGITSLKMEASFELLVSIENRNHLDIYLEGIGGKLSHDGKEVGTFTVARSTIQSVSISDLLVTCTVVPDKWEALGLVSDYYHGVLVLSISANGAFRIRGFETSLPIKIDDYVVRVSDPTLNDRHLCACPQWSDVTPSFSPKGMLFPMVLDDVALVSKD